MIQAIVLSVILVEVTTNNVGNVDKARMDEGRRGIAKDNRLEFRDREEGGELNEVCNELESARKISGAHTKSVTSLERADNLDKY